MTPRRSAGSTARTLAVVVATCAALALASDARAQHVEPDAASPAFAVSSSQTFTTQDSAFINLTFRHLTQLDFRVYKVRDPLAFFAGLRDPHQLGSEAPVVPEERSWIERLADWKAGQRRTVRSFLRTQVSPEYRTVRRAAQDRAEIAQRVVLNETSFAQVPLLNPQQLVTSWRELLPDRRDTEYRRVPVQIAEPGVYLVEAVSATLRAYTIVVVSDIGIVSKVAPGQVFLFAAHRFSGEPQSGCEVQVLVDGHAVGRGRTDVDGVLALALPETSADNVLSLARCGDHTVATDPGGYHLSEPLRQLVGYVYTDKPIYRPGHRVHIKAVLRWRERDALRPFEESSAEIAVRDLNDKVVFRQEVSPDAFGAVHGSFEIPPTAALGTYDIRIASGEHQANGAFQVQEYRRPEFEVVVSPAQRFVVQGREAVATVQARYYFGQPVANARVRYVVNQQPYYSPLRWDDSLEEGGGSSYWYGGDQTSTGELRLDDQGRGEIRIPLALDQHGRDYSARIEAQVTDASSREVAGNTIVHATYGAFLLSTRVGGYLYPPSAPVSTAVTAVDYTGGPQANVPVRLILERVTYPEGRYSEPVRTQVAETQTATGADGAAAATLALGAEPGTYVVRATARAGERDVHAESWVWVAGADDEGTDDGDQYVELIADKRTYQPGEHAQLAVRGDAISGPVLVTKEGQLVSWHAVVRPAGGDAIHVPITAQDVGDVYVHVAYLRDGRLYRAERRLAVPATQQTLQITLSAQSETAKPQEPGVFSVQVTDAAGAPVSAQLSLGVVDEAVYAIQSDDTPDPVRFFHRREYSRVGTAFSRDYYFIGYSGSERLQLAGRRRRPFTLADFKGDKPVQPQVRKEFPDAIYWIGDLVTDAQGQAKVSVKYPDALTTWRFTVRAITRDTRAGVALARTTTTKDLIVRVITPRFLTEGDRVVLPTIAHNYVSDAKETAVSLAAAGLSASDADIDRSRTGVITAGGERRDDWHFHAAAPGTAVITATARTDRDTDAVELPLPVLAYGLRREAGSSGSIAGDVEHTSDLAIPASSNPAGRQVVVSLAPSLAGSLLGALDFLTSFPYGCTEQTLSSFLPNVLVTRTLTQLQLLPTERLSLLDRQVASGLRRLVDLQHDDGGWGWWKTDENHPFMTAYALFGLAEARRAGYQVDTGRIQTGAQALAQLHAEYPNAEPDLKAYLVYVLGRVLPAEERPAQYDHTRALDELWNARARMTAYGRALLLQALDEVSDRRGDELARTLAAEAQSRGDLTWWVSDRDPLLFETVDTSVEATALAVQALARRDPSSPLLDRAVRWLMLNRRGGYWWNTKQTAFALYGLIEVLQARNEKPDTFTVDVVVNGRAVGSHTFTPRSFTEPDPVVLTAPAREGVNSLRLVKRGGGTLYWSAGAVYYDTQAAQSRSGSRELAIARRYARLVPVRQRDRVVYEEQPFDGRINPGDVLTVRLTVAGANDWRYLIVEDPLPAGVEAIQDTTAYPTARERSLPWWWGSQTEYRDNRTVFFQERFDGRAEFVYLVKAISSGEFRAMPAQVWPMYVPDVAASSDAMQVIVNVPGGATP
jgi:alpha-2-macroglobulin